MMIRCAFMLAVVVVARADIYLHVPRGSNNRLNEQSAERTNANRLFDSQNNNRGGYNAGDSTERAAGDEQAQYRMRYFQSGPPGGGESYLTVEWTNQHGCGGSEDNDPHKMNCNLVLQYMCQEETGTFEGDEIRNGGNTQTQNYPQINNLQENEGSHRNREQNSQNQNRGLHEPFRFYDSCFARERNQGLFTADQTLQVNKFGYSSAIYTRQNPTGNRRGYECPEERDYYPYWHGSSWKDIAIMVSNLTQCQYYETESFNVKSKYECVEYFDGNKNSPRRYSRWNNQQECVANEGDWLEFFSYLEKAPENSQVACEASGNTWGRPYRELQEQCLVPLGAPDCVEAPWTRDNHLGNSRGGEASRYIWTLPYLPSGETKRCVLRMRYNVSTDDYDPINTDASHNKDVETGQQSPVQQNPYIDIGAESVPLRLAINTAQYGRTFQDRSHAFNLVPRPSGLDDRTIFNINVRGKRGNIVQVYPAVEYDFVPNDLEIEEGDLVHVQWTGSNRHNNENPGGDGQTGNAGEGRDGADRNNMVESGSADENYPLPYEQTSLFKNAEVHWTAYGQFTGQDLAVGMASSGYYQCMESATCGTESVEGKDKLQNQLDNAPASYSGALIEPVRGVYYYICSRNNNFTNRSQKGKLTVTKRSS